MRTQQTEQPSTVHWFIDSDLIFNHTQIKKIKHNERKGSMIRKQNHDVVHDVLP